MVKKTIYKDRLAPRRRKPICLIIPNSGEKIYIFSPKGVEGIYIASERDYKRDGKWSYSTWEITHDDSTTVLMFYEDFEMGTFFPQTSWEEGYAWMNHRAPQIKWGAFEQFIRDNFPVVANDWDEYERQLKQLNIIEKEGGEKK